MKKEIDKKEFKGVRYYIYVEIKANSFKFVGITNHGIPLVESVLSPLIPDNYLENFFIKRCEQRINYLKRIEAI